MKPGRYLLMGVKYLFSAVLICLSFRQTGSPLYVVIGLSELIMTGLLSNDLVRRNRVAGYVVDALLVLCLNAQFLLLYFAADFLSPVMLDNVMAIDMLRGKALLYIIAALLVVLLSFLPIVYVPIGGGRAWGTGFAMLALQLGIALYAGNQYFPFYRLTDTVVKEVQTFSLRSSTQTDSVDGTPFFLGGTPQALAKAEALVQQPNIIMIFAEGVSEGIIEDERNVTPNLKRFMEQSVSFSNYYNHTAATYRGLNGTLYSGYQLMNLDRNHLVSLQSMLKREGYHTGFINVEPANATFTNYLANMEFDEVISPANDGQDDLVYDDTAYACLAEQADRLEQAGTPFFLGIYTIGTHISFASPGEVFGDGASDLLNRFYYMDLRFGEFFAHFCDSALADNTILIFTTDHCTYANEEYLQVYDAEGRWPFIDTIPFAIYYKGITPMQYDAGGRNSLDCVPTICDFLDLSQPNYFLGTTLFSDFGEIDNDFDTITSIGIDLKTTFGGVVSELQEEQKNVIEKRLTQYYTLAKAENHF